MINMTNEQLLGIFESTLLPKKNCKNFEFLYEKYQKKELDDEFFDCIKEVIVPRCEKLIEDTYSFFINTLGLLPSDALAAFNRLIEKCRLHEVKELRYHLVSDIRLKEAYKEKFKKDNFKEFYINYLKTAIKNEG